MRARPLTLSMQLSCLLVGVMLAVQVMMIFIDRLAEVDRLRQQARDKGPEHLLGVVKSLQTMPQDQRQGAARTFSRSGNFFYARLVPGLHPSDRRDTAFEAKALEWWRSQGLDVAEVRAAKRHFYEHPNRPPPGVAGNRSKVLAIGSVPPTAMRRHPELVPPWVTGDWASLDPSGLTPALSDPETGPPRTKPEHRPPGMPPEAERQAHSEVYTLALRLNGSEQWVTLYALMLPPKWNVPIAKLWMALLGSSVLGALAILIARRVVAPIRDLHHATESLGRTDFPEPLSPRGPQEVRDIIEAFNRMNARLSQSVEYQTGLLHSLGHDLKGPLGAARRLTGRIEDAGTRAAMDDRLSQVQRTIDAIMSFARAVTRDGELEDADLACLLQTVVDEQMDDGARACAHTPDRLIVPCRSGAMERCLRNLVENAIKYGGSVEAWLHVEDTLAVITIDDDGPGIDADALDSAFRPFTRLSTAQPGTGLGLSIARTIAVDHGGTVTLENRSSGGLRARLCLPLGPAARQVGSCPPALPVSDPAFDQGQNAPQSRAAGRA